MRIVIFSNPDGTITTRTPTQNPHPGSLSAQQDGESADDYFERSVAGPNRKGGTRVGDGDDANLPSGHQHFKVAREWDGAQVIVNLAKARPIHLNDIRLARNEKLLSLDKDWMRALGQKDTALADTIEAERQVLRDLPQTFDLTVATTPDELKVLWPIGLPHGA